MKCSPRLKRGFVSIRGVRTLRLLALLNGLVWAGLSTAAEKAGDELQELILPAAIHDRAPVAVVVYRRGSQYFVPFTQSKDLGLTHARPTLVPGIPEPVIEALEVTGVEEELLRATVPLTYFAPQRFQYLHANETAPLEPLPAAWVSYNLFHQPTQGLRALGGTVSLVTNIREYSLNAMWLLNREVEGARLLRASTSLEKSLGRTQLTLGDVSISQDLPLLSNRQAIGLQLRSQGRRDSTVGTLQFAGIVPSSGVLSVLANQQLLYRAPASVGTYELKGLPSIAGQTRYEVYFDDGQSVRLLDSLLSQTPVANLPKGAFEYQVSFGAPRLLDSKGQGLEYAKELVLDATATYGWSHLHQVSAQTYLSREETWAGGSVRTEWSPRLSSRIAAHAVSSSKGSGLLTALAAQYSSADFRVGASHAWFNGKEGTRDGFISESKAFVGYSGLSLTLLQSEHRAEFGPSQYRTFGVSKSMSRGRLSVNFSASNTWRDGVKGKPYVAVMVNWSLDDQTRVSATVSREQTTLSASYQSEQDWGLTAERATHSDYTSNTINGYYTSALGTWFGSTGAGSNTLGLSGGLAMYKGPVGWGAQPLGRHGGDSLLVVQAGSAQVEVTVEAQQRYKTNKDGLASIPFTSSLPQRVGLDLLTLDPQLTALQTQHLVKTDRGRAHLLTFETAAVGYELSLKRPNGSFVSEGSLAYLPSGTLIVSDEGGLWLEEAVPSFKVQLGPNEFCTVTTGDKPGIAECF